MTYRNPRLLALARLAPHCFCCGRQSDGTIVAAHANTQAMGKGTGIKAADLPAYICATCHDAIDGRINYYPGRPERNAAWYEAAILSMRWALEHYPEVFCQRGMK